MVKEIGEGLQAIAKAISQLDAGILAVGAALLADLSIIEGQLAGKIDLSILASEAIDAVQQIRYIQKTYMNPVMQNPGAFPEETLQELQNDILEPTRGIGFQLNKIQDAMAGRGFAGVKPLLQTYRENGWNCAVEECDFHSAFCPLPLPTQYTPNPASHYFCNTISAGSRFQISVAEGEQRANAVVAVARQANLALSFGCLYDNDTQKVDCCLRVQSYHLFDIHGRNWYCVDPPETFPAKFRAAWLTVSTNQTHASADGGFYCGFHV